MSDIKERVQTLVQEVNEAIDRLGIVTIESQAKKLQEESQAADFWSNSQQAQNTMKRLANLQARSKPWLELKSTLSDLQELADLNDTNLEADLNVQLHHAQQQYNKLKEQLTFNKPYDDHSVILAIYAGAGGTDAQDWAQMLQRMYVRWAEKRGLKPEVVDYSSGEEAGIKSVVLELNGPFAYGKLKGEHGVHRLVRLSPFNADNLRQTSFAKVDVLPKIDIPNEIELDEKDLKIDVYRSGGHGGQSVNTTDSAVRVTHIPTGITVAIQNERSQIQNKETAMTILRSRLAKLQLEQHKEKLGELKGPNQSAEWGNQIRSYVLHPYKQVKDLRTKYESSDPDKVLNGELDPFINAYLEFSLLVEHK